MQINTVFPWQTYLFTVSQGTETKKLQNIMNTKNIKRIFQNVWNFTRKAIAFLLLIIIFLVLFVLLTASFLTSILWMPIAMFCCPKRAAETMEYSNIEGEFPTSLLEAEFVLFSICMRFCWHWTTHLLPMSKRQYFIEISDLSELSVKDQVKYYLVTKDKNCLRSNYGVSKDALEQIWSTVPEERINILKFNSYRPTGFSLTDDISLLKQYLEKTEKISVELVNSFICKISNDSTECYSTLFTKFADIAIKAMDSSSAMLVAKKIEWSSNREFLASILEQYLKTKTLSEECLIVLANIIVNDTNASSKTPSELAFNILTKAVTRDGVSPKICAISKDFSEERRKEILRIIKMHCDIHEVENKTTANWEKFCQVSATIADEAQAKMSKEQYQIFRANNHSLSDKAFHHLVVIRPIDEDYLSLVLSDNFDRVISSDELYEELKCSPDKFSMLVTIASNQNGTAKLS